MGVMGVMGVCACDGLACNKKKKSHRFALPIFQWWIFGTIAGVSGGLLYALDSVNASDAKAMPANLPWGHKEHLKGFDHAR